MNKTYETDWTVHENAMLSDVRYYENNQSEYFVVLWKDLLSKDKRNNIEIIENPKVPIYFMKPKFRTSENMYMCPLDKLDMVPTRPSQIKKCIAEAAGANGRAIYRAAVQSHDWKRLREFYRLPYSYGADFPPDMFYRIWWAENCANDLTPYVKPAFSDIEVDIIDRTASSIDLMLNQAIDPINIISIFFEHENDMHIYVMIPDGKLGGDLAPRQLQSYMDICNNREGFLNEIHDLFDATYGKIDYHFHWYKREDELRMIIDYFALINKRRPDFVGFWNMSFDMPYMMRRCEVLGANPADVICDPNFPVQYLRFKKDERHFEIKESNDFLYSSTVPQYICLMRTYAKHRKQTLYPSYSLDAISEFELGENKLKYGDDGENIRNLAYMDYRKFILYNIKDTLLTKQIDKVTEDCFYTWICSNQNFSSFDIIHSPSLSLRNIVYNEFLRQAIGEY